MRAGLALLLLADVGAPREGVDLLSLVDPARDALRGGWRADGAAIVMEPASRLQIPCVPPGEFDLVLHVERQSDVGKLLVGLGPFDVVIDNWHAGEHRAGMHWLDGRHVTEYPARIGAVFRNDVLHRIVYSVRRDTVVVQVDGREIVRFEGDFKRAGLDRRTAPPRRGALFVANELSRFRISRIRLMPRLGRPTLLAEPGRCPLPGGEARWRCGTCARVFVAGDNPVAPRCCALSASKVLTN
jgi:hypothetical protein